MKVKELIDRMFLFSYLSKNLDDIEERIKIFDGKGVRKAADTLDPSKDLYDGIVVATDVYQCEDGYVGVRSIYQGKESSVDSVYVVYGEMKKVNDTIYKVKYFNRVWAKCKDLSFKEDRPYERRIRMYSIYELKEELGRVKSLRGKSFNFCENGQFLIYDRMLGLIRKEFYRRTLCNIKE